MLAKPLLDRPAPSPLPGTAVPRPGLRVLAIPAGRSGIRDVVRLIDRAGHQVEVATDGRSSQAVLPDRDVDVILFEVGPGGVAGRSAAKLLDASSVWKRPFCIAVGPPPSAESRRGFEELTVDLYWPRCARASLLLQILGRLRDILRPATEFEELAFDP